MCRKRITQNEREQNTQQRNKWTASTEKTNEQASNETNDTKLPKIYYR